jgi:hypothetical protein
MDHSFYHKRDGKKVEATVVGYVEFSADRSVRSLNLVTEHEKYNAGEFGVAVRSR